MHVRHSASIGLIAGAASTCAVLATTLLSLSAGGPTKTGDIHGAVVFPSVVGTQGLDVYIPGKSFLARLDGSGDFTLYQVPEGTHGLMVATPEGRILHTLSGISVEPRMVTELPDIVLIADSDGDGWDILSDCDDMDSAVYPGAVELADGIDNDCDGLVDEGFSNWTDADSDGYPAQAGWNLPVDCDDSDASVHPGASEVCDGRDNDCDGLVDEGFDQDGDGYTACNGDCDDADPNIHPGADESLADGLDNDCDGVIDEDADQDQDGYTISAGDCDDLDPSVYPNAPELADGIDNDCDGQVDEGL